LNCPDKKKTPGKARLNFIRISSCSYFVFQIPTGKASSSGLAVAIGCGVAGAIVGTASIAFATKRILAHRARAAYDLIDDPQPDGP